MRTTKAAGRRRRGPPRRRGRVGPLLHALPSFGVGGRSPAPSCALAASRSVLLESSRAQSQRVGRVSAVARSRRRSAAGWRLASDAHCATRSCRGLLGWSGAWFVGAGAGWLRHAITPWVIRKRRLGSTARASAGCATRSRHGSFGSEGWVPRRGRRLVAPRDHDMGHSGAKAGFHGAGAGWLRRAITTWVVRKRTLGSTARAPAGRAARSGRGLLGWSGASVPGADACRLRLTRAVSRTPSARAPVRFQAACGAASGGEARRGHHAEGAPPANGCGPQTQSTAAARTVLP